MNKYLVLENTVYGVVVSNFKPKNTVALVPDHFSEEDYPYLKSRIKFNEELGIDETEVYLDEVDKGIGMQRSSVSNQHSQIQKSYENDVYGNMRSVFNTTNRAKAKEKYLTWKDMAENPELYSDQGLVDEAGQALDSHTKVKEFAENKVQQVRDYNIFLMKREAQRDADIAQVE